MQQSNARRLIILKLGQTPYPHPLLVTTFIEASTARQPMTRKSNIPFSIELSLRRSINVRILGTIFCVDSKKIAKVPVDLLYCGSSNVQSWAIQSRKTLTNGLNAPVKDIRPAINMTLTYTKFLPLLPAGTRETSAGKKPNLPTQT